MIVAIDGPAGAGKSSIAKIVAKKLSLEYIDSGAIYRSISKKILDSRIKIDDYTQIEKLLANFELAMESDKVFINNEDLSPYIRDIAVTEAVSVVSVCPAVRVKVNNFLNYYAKGKSVIMDGRDIGTEVFPDADFKFYLDASVEERARRRYEEKHKDSITLEEIKDSIMKRDYNDMNRKIAPLVRAENAIYIDTTKLTIDKVVNKIIECIK